jgi:hypothetical protein
MTMPADARIDRLRIATDGVVLDARFEVPPAPCATIVVATTKSASRAPVVDIPPLLERGFAVLVVDLLAGIEHDDARRRLDVFLLARRLVATTEAAVRRRDGLRDLPLGYLGIDTAAAGALIASLDDPCVDAIVCLGRPDLAEGILGRVTAPTLLVAETPVLALNRSALKTLQCPKRLRLASRTVAAAPIAVTWFVRHLNRAAPPLSMHAHERHTVRGALPRYGKRPRIGRDEIGPRQRPRDGRVLASEWP